MDKKFKRQDKYPRQTRDEEISYKVYYYSDVIPKPGWIGTQTFDSLDKAKEYAECRLRDEKRVKKTIVMKCMTITKRACVMDTLKTNEEPKDE